MQGRERDTEDLQQLRGPRDGSKIEPLRAPMHSHTIVCLASVIAVGVSLSAQSSPSFDALSARLDPYVEKSRVIVMTDIANEPDDQMSMVRFLVYSNQYDIEGLIASTSTWMRNKVRPDVITTLLDASR